MPRFNADVTDGKGQRHPRAGLNAADESSARAALEARGFTVHSVWASEPVPAVAADPYASALAERHEEPHVDANTERVVQSLQVLITELRLLQVSVEKLQTRRLFRLSQWQIAAAVVFAIPVGLLLFVILAFFLSIVLQSTDLRSIMYGAPNGR